MISKSYSYSKEFNSVNEFDQVLFLMIQPHLDDFGKIEGEAEIVKARVLPLSKKPFKDFEIAICNLIRAGLIERYEIKGIKIIRYPKFDKEQIGLNKRTISDYPDPDGSVHSNNFHEVPRSSQPSEQNISEPNLKEVNKSEYKNVADKNSVKSIGEILNPNRFLPKNAAESEAKEVWLKLEPDNSRAFYTTYLKAAKQGLPGSYFRQFMSEIKQSKTDKPGAVFNTKVKGYFEKHGIKTKPSALQST